MKYLKVWTNFRELMMTLRDDEKGRLFEMMLAYAESGNEPEEFEGNERFLWPVAKQQIDLAFVKNEVLRTNGMKGGRPKTKENQTEPNETNENQTKAYKEKKKKEIEKNNTVSPRARESDPAFDRFWSEYPNKVAKQDAIKAWNKIQPDENTQEQIMTGLARWKAGDEWSRDDGRYIPHPATWLNGRRWEDDVRPRIQGIRIASQAYGQRDYSGEQEDAMRRMISMG